MSVERANLTAKKTQDEAGAGAESSSEKQRRRGLGGFLTWPFVLGAAPGTDLLSSDSAKAVRNQEELDDRARVEKTGDKADGSTPDGSLRNTAPRVRSQDSDYKPTKP